MKIREIKLIKSDTVSSLNNTGFSININNKYEISIEETTELGFKAVNQIEVLAKLSQELNNFLNEFAKKCVSELNIPKLQEQEVVTYTISKSAVENLARLSLSESINNHTI